MNEDEIEAYANRNIIVQTGNARKFVKKAWGYELWIHNSELYCGKILHINQGAKFSMHYHVIKNETWYIAKGKLILKTIDVNTANTHEVILNEGDIVEVFAGLPHQLQAIEESDVFEVSTEHYDFDSYRVGKGDSQE